MTEETTKKRARGRPKGTSQYTTAFNIGRTKAYEEIKKGRLKARKLGARTIITHEDAMAWLNTLPELVK